MGLFFRSIRYGSFKTRIYLILLTVALLGGIGAMAAGLIISSLLPMIIGTAMLIAGGAMFIPLKSVIDDVDRKEKDLQPENPLKDIQVSAAKKETAHVNSESGTEKSSDRPVSSDVLKGKNVGEVSVIHDPESVPQITADEAKESLLNIKKSLFTQEGAYAGMDADALMPDIGKKKKRETRVFDSGTVNGRTDNVSDGNKSDDPPVAEIDKRGLWNFKTKTGKEKTGKNGEYRGLAGSDDTNDLNTASNGRGAVKAGTESKQDDRNTVNSVQGTDKQDPSGPSFYVGRDQRVGIKRSERQKRINREAEALRAGRAITPESKRNGDITDENDELIRGAEKRIDYLKTYTMSNVKKLMKEYKVSKDYVPVIIDRCKRYDVSRTPALCWKKGNDINFLVFEASSRVISIPYFDFRRVTYRHNVPEHDLQSYDYIRKNMASYEMFEDVMPTFSVTGNKLGAMEYSKNLYVFGGLVEIPPAGMRALNEKFSLELKLFESLNLKGKYDQYFSDAYEAKILWTDNVISQKAFQDRIRTILQKMVDDDKLMWYDFNDDLTQMIRYKLVTDEYAEYFRSRKQMR